METILSLKPRYRGKSVPLRGGSGKYIALFVPALQHYETSMACTESMLLTNRAALLSYFVGLSVKLFGIYIYSFCFDYVITICILLGLQFS